MCYSTYAGKRLMTLVYRAMVDRAGIDRVLDIGPGQGLYSRLMRPMAPQVAWSCIEYTPPTSAI